jgi:PIN domain nuclease of toxin-antitoxin system
MGHLFDTSAFYWAAAEPARLSTAAVTAFADMGPPRWLRAATTDDRANTNRLGKLAMFRPSAFTQAAAALSLKHLPIADADALAAALIDSPHRDPWDRIIAAQAQAHGLKIVSPDLEFDGLGAQRLW